MTRKELIEYCLTFAGAVEDYLFEDKSTIMRHIGKGKWFAVIFEERESSASASNVTRWKGAV